MTGTSIKRKVGRKAAHYRTSWGEVINGLARRPSDGIWRVIATGQKFTEPDERLAVHLFRTRFATDRTAAVALTIPIGPNPTPDTPPFTTIDAVSRQITHHIPEAVTWAWVREQILTRPSYVAQMTGVPEIGYLASLPKPQAAPTLKSIGDLYVEKAQITEHERNKSKFIWGEFMQTVGVATVRDLTATVFADYGDKVLAADNSPTYTRHRFGKVKTIINFARTRGVQPMADLRAALDAAAVLRSPKPSALDPHPIAREHFHALLDKVNEDAQMTAILLLALNACMYGAEVASVRWTHLDLDRGVLVANRGKTGVTRVAVLWPRTVEMLRKLPRTIDSPFLADQGKAHNGNTITKIFRKLRESAELPDVKFEDVRDGAYTNAVEGYGVQFEHARLLGGHRVGMSDHYIKRNPRLVASACAAVEQAYFG